jgi:hypothetical protein
MHDALGLLAWCAVCDIHAVYSMHMWYSTISLLAYTHPKRSILQVTYCDAQVPRGYSIQSISIRPFGIVFRRQTSHCVVYTDFHAYVFLRVRTRRVVLNYTSSLLDAIS